jgi:hypothetical protein
MRDLKLRLALASLLVTALAGNYAAAGPRDHQDGFFLRLAAGAGTTTTEIYDGYDTYTLSGTAGDLDVAVGAVVLPNLAVHGNLFGWTASDMKVEFNGVDVGPDLPADVTAAGFGAGLTYYLMPANVYLSGTLGSGTLEIEGQHVRGETDSGVFLQFSLGKEWWVSDGWALGVAGGTTYHNFNDPDVDHDWSGWSYTLRFSATMN